MAVGRWRSAAVSTRGALPLVVLAASASRALPFAGRHGRTSVVRSRAVASVGHRGGPHAVVPRINRVLTR
jgi:hypothetical protein